MTNLTSKQMVIELNTNWSMYAAFFKRYATYGSELDKASAEAYRAKTEQQWKMYKTKMEPEHIEEFSKYTKDIILEAEALLKGHLDITGNVTSHIIPGVKKQ